MKNKCYTLFVVLTVFSLLLSACAAEPTGVVSTSTPRPTAIATQTARIIKETVVVTVFPPTPVVPATAKPLPIPATATPKIVSKPAGSVLDTTDWEYFAQFSQGFDKVELHAALIDKLDALYLGVKRNFDGGTLSTKADEVIVLWTGNYIDEDPTLNGALIPYLADHDTGLFLIKPSSTDVKIRTPFAYVTLKNWTGEMAPRPGTPALSKGDVSAASCLKNADVVPTITKMMGLEPLFAELDKMANKSPNTRLRNGWYSSIQAQAGKSIIWTKTGMVGLGWAEITHADGISLYVAKLTGPMEVMYPFSGMNLCSEYQGYNALPAVPASAAPAEIHACVANADFVKLVNQNRLSDNLIPSLALLPSTTSQPGTRKTWWNNVVITSGNVAGSNVLPLNWHNTFDGFRAVYFVTTDGQSTFAANSATIVLCDPLNPAKDFSTWWGK